MLFFFFWNLRCLYCVLKEAVPDHSFMLCQFFPSACRGVFLHHNDQANPWQLLLQLKYIFSLRRTTLTSAQILQFHPWHFNPFQIYRDPTSSVQVEETRNPVHERQPGVDHWSSRFAETWGVGHFGFAEQQHQSSAAWTGQLHFHQVSGAKVSVSSKKNFIIILVIWL